MTLLKLEGISKRFGAVQALRDVNFSLEEGEVMAIVGDNGAGKSTLIKIIAGAQSSDSGTYWFEGRRVTVKSPEDARALGIETVYQDLALFDSSNVAENIFAGRELVRSVFGIPFLRRREMHAQSSELLKSLRIHMHSTKLTVKSMSGGQRQSVAVARAAAFGRRVVILDEPTAALGVAEQQKVLALIADLKTRGFSVIVISHNLGHVFQVSDRISVMRQGTCIGVRNVSETTSDEIVKLITGSDTAIRH